MEAGGVLRLKVDKIIVGEVGVICAAADTGRRKTVMQIAVRGTHRETVCSIPFTMRSAIDKGYSRRLHGAGKTIEKDRLDGMMVERGVCRQTLAVRVPVVLNEQRVSVVMEE